MSRLPAKPSPSAPTGSPCVRDVVGRGHIMDGHQLGNVLPDVVDQINAHHIQVSQHHGDIAHADADQDGQLLRYQQINFSGRRTVEAAEHVGDARNGGDPEHQHDDHQHHPADHLPIKADHRAAPQVGFERDVAEANARHPPAPFDGFVSAVDERQNENRTTNATVISRRFHAMTTNGNATMSTVASQSSQPRLKSAPPVAAKLAGQIAIERVFHLVRSSAACRHGSAMPSVMDDEQRPSATRQA